MSDDIRLAVLASIIREHGPVPCIHVSVVRTFEALRTGEGMSADGKHSPRTSVRRFRCEPSELAVTDDGAVVLQLRTPAERSTSGGIVLPVPEALRGRIFEDAAGAARERDRLCAALGCLPWDLTALGTSLDAQAVAQAVAQALAHVQVGSEGVQALGKSTEGISAMTFGDSAGSTPDRPGR